MYTAVAKHVSLRVSLDGLMVDPWIPSAWPGFRVTRRWRGATYNITAVNPNGVQQGMAWVMLNGESA